MILSDSILKKNTEMIKWLVLFSKKYISYSKGANEKVITGLQICAH